MRLCLFLLLAGLMDAILTYMGMKSGIVEEGNPIMRFVIEKGLIYFYLIKFILPLVLMGLFYLSPFTGKLRSFLVVTCFLYVTVLVYHLIWILLYMNNST